MRTTFESQQKVWTEAELQSLPDDGFIYEVVNGELVMSPKNNFQHEQICARLFNALYVFNEARRLGVVLGSGTGFWMHNRNCRAPDLSFISKARLREHGFTPTTRRFFPAAPDLAVEVLSPSNTRQEIEERLRDFFASGTRLAWVIDPDAESVEVCRTLTQRRLVGSGAALEGEALLPAFTYPIADLFKGWDWE
jgi:Uma2 family endonuclease